MIIVGQDLGKNNDFTATIPIRKMLAAEVAGAFAIAGSEKRWWLKAYSNEILDAEEIQFSDDDKAWKPVHGGSIVRAMIGTVAESDRERVVQAIAAHNTYRLIGTPQQWRGIRYTDVVRKTVKLLRLPQFAGAILAPDWSGVGSAVVDMYRELNVQMVPIQITGGRSISKNEHSGYNVAKVELVSCLLRVLGERRIILGSPKDDGVRQLLKEIGTFQEKLRAKGTASYEAEKDDDHDDMVLALMLAVFVGENLLPEYTGKIVLNDPAPLDGEVYSFHGETWYFPDEEDPMRLLTGRR